MENYKYELNEYNFGSVEYIPEGNSPHNLSRLISHPNNQPKLVHKIDASLWNDYWKSQLKNSELYYNDFGFEKNFIGGYWKPKETLQELDKEIRNLTEAYDKAAIKYNKEIAEPFIESRRNLLIKFLNKK